MLQRYAVFLYLQNVNVVSVENLAKVAAKHDIKLVWFSSDQIYNGNTGLEDYLKNQGS